MEEDEQDQAREELKRIDHLIFVTLKYTRTADIIRTIVGKFILALDYETEKFYELKFERKEIKSIPPVPLMRMKNLEQLYSKDQKVKDVVDFYIYLKSVFNAEYKAKEEYRKNVTLVTKSTEINIAMLKEYMETTRNHVEYLEGILKQ